MLHLEFSIQKLICSILIPKFRIWGTAIHKEAVDGTTGGGIATGGTGSGDGWRCSSQLLDNAAGAGLWPVKDIPCADRGATPLKNEKRGYIPISPQQHGIRMSR
jgi:hypothetical protein